MSQSYHGVPNPLFRSALLHLFLQLTDLLDGFRSESVVTGKRSWPKIRGARSQPGMNFSHGIENKQSR
jgi:hypothetical protein